MPTPASESKIIKTKMERSSGFERDESGLKPNINSKWSDKER